MKNDLALTQTPLGRICLHLRCVNRNFRFRWHGNGIARELRELLDDTWFKLTTHRACSWCQKRLHHAPLAFLFRLNTTHTICPTCHARLKQGFHE